MAINVFWTRRSTAVPGTGREPFERSALPAPLVAVGEAWISGAGSVDACREAGRGLASVGTPLEEALDGLRTTSRQVLGRDPSYEEVHALGSGWADCTLGYLHRLDCADPMTGLSTQAHLVARLSEVLAAGGEPPALLVVEVSPADDPVEHAYRVGAVGETVRAVVGRSRTVGRVGPRRIAALVSRDDALGSRVALLRRLLQHDHDRTRVWIEGLPAGTGHQGAAGADEAGAAAVALDELARG
ncbi:hypothetical protein [Nocardioides ferulae]|uniref:hypothetical protein n=1 Tax=Nocardioides ferulae TaxID=2340821 RepID=UPI000EAB943F|nr:hypothetical protein [Nocardioides ferulae]